MLETTSGFVDIYGVKLHYYRTGGSKPPLVLVHGVTDDGLCWLPVAEVFAPSYDVIMVDTRGHGKSDAPDSGYTLKTLALELAGLIQELHLQKPLIMGHSMGAITVLVLAGLFPDLPRAVILEDPPAFWMPEIEKGQPSEHANYLAAWIESNKRKTHDDLLAEVHANNPQWQEAEIEPWINSKHRYSTKISALIQSENVRNLDFPAILNNITCPTLLFSADMQRGAASKPEDIAALQKMVRPLQVVHFVGAGHNIRRDQFDQYIQTTRHFFDSLPS